MGREQNQHERHVMPRLFAAHVPAPPNTSSRSSDQLTLQAFRVSSAFVVVVRSVRSTSQNTRRPRRKKRTAMEGGAAATTHTNNAADAGFANQIQTRRAHTQKNSRHGQLGTNEQRTNIWSVTCAPHTHPCIWVGVKASLPQHRLCRHTICA